MSSTISSSAYQNFKNSRDSDSRIFFKTAFEDGILGPYKSLSEIFCWRGSETRVHNNNIAKITRLSEAELIGIDQDIAQMEHVFPSLATHEFDAKNQIVSQFARKYNVTIRSTQACAQFIQNLKATRIYKEIVMCENLIRAHKEKQGTAIAHSLAFTVSLFVRKFLTGLIAAGIIFATPFVMALLTPFPLISAGLFWGVVVVLPVITAVSALSTIAAIAISACRAVSSGNKIKFFITKIKELEKSLPARHTVTLLSISKHPQHASTKLLAAQS